MLQQISCLVYNFWISIVNPHCQYNIPQTGLKSLQSYCAENQEAEHSPARAESPQTLQPLPLPRGSLPGLEASSATGQHVSWDQAAGNRAVGERCDTPLFGGPPLCLGAVFKLRLSHFTQAKTTLQVCTCLADFDCNPHPWTWLSGLTSDLLHHYGFVWRLQRGDWTSVNITRPPMLSGTVGPCWWVHCPVSLAAALRSWLFFPWGTVRSSSSLTNSTCEMYSK